MDHGLRLHRPYAISHEPLAMTTFRVTLAYDGTDLVGWQRQATGVSVQGLLEEALRELDQRNVTVTGAGRTDAGVHALGQVAAFSIEHPLTAQVVIRALNARLPDAVRVLSAEEMPATFHARFGARAKTYRYRILNGDIASPFERRYAWHVPGALDLDAMKTAARLLEGVHDFAAFQSAGSDVTTTKREISCSRISTTEDTEDTEEKSFCRTGPHLCVPRVLRGGEVSNGGAVVCYEITGNGFLRHMVRAIAGSLVEVGRGRRPPNWMADVLASRDRGRAGPTAPAKGLFLVSVTYGVVESRFTPKEP
jgi:tRNA pseudouridine38-40 synthase